MNRLQAFAFWLLGVKNQEQREIIEDILEGKKYVYDKIHDYFCIYYEKRKKFFEITRCTEREIEVGKICVLAEKGFSQKKIADATGLTTTQVHTRCKKYGIHTIGMKL